MEDILQLCLFVFIFSTFWNFVLLRYWASKGYFLINSISRRSLSQFFVLLSSSTEWKRPTHIWEGNPDLNINSPPMPCKLTHNKPSHTHTLKIPYQIVRKARKLWRSLEMHFSLFYYMVLSLSLLS